MERDEICKGCGGIGGAAGAVKRCGNCQGSGIQVNLYTPKDDFKRLFRQTKVRQLGPGMLQQIRASCDEVCHDFPGRFQSSQMLLFPLQCQGLGELVDPELRCSKCEGKRVRRGKTVVEVEVKEGMIDGQKIVFTGEGDQASGVESGDVVVVLHEEKHDIFQRRSSDLVVVIEVKNLKRNLFSSSSLWH